MLFSGGESGMDLRSQLEGLQALHAATLGNPQICVAILDGPVDLSHPCFEASYVEILWSGGVVSSPAPPLPGAC